MSTLTVGPFGPDHTGRFLALASREGWVVLPWEIPWLQQLFPRGCLAAFDADGIPRGFVTACPHRKSGWIGNLIVEESYRGGGIGSLLFSRALQALSDAGAETVWLTASEAGKPIYERAGFRTVDQIRRHCGEIPPDGAMDSPPLRTSASFHEVDRYGWGDDRSGLLKKVSEEGVLRTDGSGFVVLQPVDGRIMAGPWGGRDPDRTGRLLMLCGSSPPLPVFVDSPAGNRKASRTLATLGFSVTGETWLMYRGTEPDYHPEAVWGLATMGSCG